MASSPPLSEAAFDILLSLVNGPLHGYAMIQAIEASRQGRAMQPGLLYTTLPKLLEPGWVEETAAPPGNTDKRRRFYRLTPPGHAVLVAEAQRRVGQAQRVLETAHRGEWA